MRRFMIGLLIFLLITGVGVAVGSVTDGLNGQLTRFGIFSGEVTTEGNVRVGRGITPFRVESTTTVN